MATGKDDQLLAQELRDEAAASLDLLIERLSDAVERHDVLANVFPVAKLAIETLAPIASVSDLMNWSSLLLNVGDQSTGVQQAEAYALAFQIMTRLT